MKRLIALILFASYGAAASSPADYAAVFPIQASGKQATWLIELNADVYRWSQDERLRDIAIFNAAGNPVPLGPWDKTEPGEVIENRANVALLTLPVTLVPKNDPSVLRFAGGGSDGNAARQPEVHAVEVRPTTPSRPTRQWLIDTSNLSMRIDTITLDWTSPKSGVVARFDVVGSSDLEHWLVVKQGATIVVLDQDDTHIERRDIKLDRGSPNYLRLTRTDDGPDLEGLRAEVSGKYHSKGRPAPLHWVHASYQSTVNDNASSDVQYRYLLPAAFPISQIRIALSEENALARLHVLTAVDASDGSKRWSSRGQTIAYRLQRGDSLVESQEMQLSAGPRIRELRIDSATPLASPPVVEAGYRAQRVAFLAEGEGPYVLAVGSSVERYPEYPMDTAFARLREYPAWQPSSAALGDMQTSAGERAIAAPAHVTKADAPGWKRGLLWTVLILAAAVVGGLSLSLLRGAGQRGTEDRQQPPEE